MCVLFAVLSAALLLTLIWQRIQYKKLQKEINYISSRLETLSITSANGFVLLPTDNACVKKLGAAINTLLQNFYEKKSEFEQAQKAMAQVLTNISHDIRTPLTVLKGNSQMLATKVDDLSVPEVKRRMFQDYAKIPFWNIMICLKSSNLRWIYRYRIRRSMQTLTGTPCCVF